MSAENNKQATTGRTLGIIGLFAWLLPIVGLPVTIVGLVKSNAGLDSDNASTAQAGVTMNIIGLVLSVFNALAGFMLAM